MELSRLRNLFPSSNESVARFALPCISLLALETAPVAQADELAFDERHNMVSYPIVSPIDSSKVELTTREYDRGADASLRLDLYMPRARNDQLLPVVVLASSTRNGSIRDRAQYISWAKAIASDGMAALVYESAWDSLTADLGHVFRNLCEHGEEWGVDPSRIGAFACSGNVFGLYDRIVDPANGVKCAVLYYGAPASYASPNGVDLLLVSAGHDAPGLNARIDELGQRAATEGANVDRIHYADGHHAFDLVNDSDRSRAIIGRTLTYWRTALQIPTNDEPKSAVLRALAHFSAEEWAPSAKAYREYLAAEPNDSLGWYRLGACEMRLERFAESATALEEAARLGRTPSTTYYDAACMRALSGEADAAVQLLSLAVSSGYSDRAHLENDADLASLRELPAFREILRGME